MRNIRKPAKTFNFHFFFRAVLFSFIIALIPFLEPVQKFFVNDTMTEAVHLPQYEMLDGWEYHWGDPGKGKVPEFGWMAVKRPINPPGRNGQTLLWLRHTLPRINWEVPVLLIDGKGVLLTFKAFINERMIYQFGKMTSSGQGNLSGISSHLIHLGNNFAGKQLVFKIFSDYSNIGIRGKVVIGSESGLIQSIIKKDFNRFVIGLFMVFMGILDLVICKECVRTSGAVSMLGIFAISAGLYTLNVTAIKDLIFPAPVFWFNVYIAAMFTIPVGAMGFIWQTFRPGYGNLYHRIWQFHFIYALVCQAGFLLILMSFLPMIVGSFMLTTLRVLLISEMLLILGVCFKDALIKGNIQARVYLCGVVPIILGGIHDLLVGLGKIESTYSFVPWALMVFILSLEIIKRQQNIKTRNRLMTYAEELEIKSKEKTELISELHDGLGGLLTSIKFLSEMGMKNPSTEGLKETLSNISKLSSDSLVEIGSFMQSLDEEEINWPVVVETLYRTGKKMVGPLGLSFDFKEKIDENVKNPNSILFLNILRIYKEGLTNILKHSEAEHVDVKINITKSTLLLSIKDDGKGFGSDIIKGRGINNMRARAQKMNGRFIINSENGTCLTLDIALRASV
jgi:signal transduction histidine kinase